MRSARSKSFTVSFLLFALSMSMSCLEANAEIRIPSNDKSRVDAHGTCRVVSNSGENEIFVPISNTWEWATGATAFLNNLTIMDAVSVSPCSAGLPLDYMVYVSQAFYPGGNQYSENEYTVLGIRAFDFPLEDFDDCGECNSKSLLRMRMDEQNYIKQWYHSITPSTVPACNINNGPGLVTNTRSNNWQRFMSVDSYIYGPDYALTDLPQNFGVFGLKQELNFEVIRAVVPPPTNAYNTKYPGSFVEDWAPILGLEYPAGADSCYLMIAYPPGLYPGEDASILGGFQHLTGRNRGLYHGWIFYKNYYTFTDLHVSTY